MAIIKCKMCGGDIELTADKTFGTCEFCGSTMTLPKIDNDQRAAAFNRGNHFRRIGEFDKALAVYERIVREDDTDAEAHWCCALCRFGIEYVEDPNTYEWLPTCHRASFDSFLEDVDYLAALAHSDGVTRRQYQRDGAKIAEVQRGILAASQNAEPFDVFICYKESDENGQRTRDSLLAQDIYYQLTEQGRKVFFARITLEDVVGTQYEPYIFAALNSAKLMIVVGTKPEYLNAVWVKNEWSRFLAMMKKDRHKLLLPCYRDMDPYDMPDQLSVLQSYDMSKIGFIQDLTRGIAKVLDADKKPAPAKETVVVQQAGSTDTAPLLKRAYMFLEDGDWNSANEYCEKVLDMDPENARAYLGKLMAQQHVKKQEDLKNCAHPFDGDSHYRKALRFGDDALKATLTSYVDHINTRNENERLSGIYNQAKSLMVARNDTAYSQAAQLFGSIPEYKDAAQLATQCRQLAEQYRKYAAEQKLLSTYNKAKSLMDIATQEHQYTEAYRLFNSIFEYKDSDELAQLCRKKAKQCHAEAEAASRDRTLAQAKNKMEGHTVPSLEEALRLLNTIPGWKDADAMANICTQRIAKIHADIELAKKIAARKAKTKRMAIALLCLAVVAAAILLFTVIIPSNNYSKAVSLMDAGNYEEAIEIFAGLGGYNDSAEKLQECCYIHGTALADAGEDAKAAMTLGRCGDYKDAHSRSRELWSTVTQLTTLSVGDGHLVGLKNDGTVVAVGSNTYGQCDVTGWDNVIAVSANGNSTMGVRYDGTVLIAGSGSNGSGAFGKASKWTNIVSISIGTLHVVGLKVDGTVVATGGYERACSVSGWKNIIAVSAGDNHTVGLKADGTVVATGDNSHGECNVSDWTDIVAISAGNGCTIAVKADGTVVATGNTDYQRCNVSEWKDVVAIATGEYHAIGLTDDGTVFATGRSGMGDVSHHAGLVAVTASHNYTVGLRADGTIEILGYASYALREAVDWNNIKVYKK